MPIELSGAYLDQGDVDLLMLQYAPHVTSAGLWIPPGAVRQYLRHEAQMPDMDQVADLAVFRHLLSGLKTRRRIDTDLSTKGGTKTVSVCLQVRGLCCAWKSSGVRTRQPMGGVSGGCRVHIQPPQPVLRAIR